MNPITENEIKDVEELNECPLCGKKDGLYVDPHISAISGDNREVTIEWIISCEYCDFLGLPQKTVSLDLSSEIKGGQVAP